MHCLRLKFRRRTPLDERMNCESIQQFFFLFYTRSRSSYQNLSPAISTGSQISIQPLNKLHPSGKCRSTASVKVKMAFSEISSGTSLLPRFKRECNPSSPIPEKSWIHHRQELITLGPYVYDSELFHQPKVVKIAENS